MTGQIFYHFFDKDTDTAVRIRENQVHLNFILFTIFPLGLQERYQLLTRTLPVTYTPFL